MASRAVATAEATVAAMAASLSTRRLVLGEYICQRCPGQGIDRDSQSRCFSCLPCVSDLVSLVGDPLFLARRVSFVLFPLGPLIHLALHPLPSCVW